MRFFLRARHRPILPKCNNYRSIFPASPQQSLPQFDTTASLNVPPQLPRRSSPPHLELLKASSSNQLISPDEDRYFSESDVDLFYKNLMDSSPNQFKQEAQPDHQLSCEEIPILGPSALVSSKQLLTGSKISDKSQHLSSSTRALHGTFPLSTDGLDLQPLSKDVEVMTIEDWQSLLLAAAFELDSDKLVQTIELMKKDKVDIVPVTNGLLTQLAHLPQLSDAEKSIAAVSEAYQKAHVTQSSAFHQARVHLLLYRSGSSPPTAYQSASAYIQHLERDGAPPAPAVYLQLFDYLSYTSQRRAHTIDLFNRIRLLAHHVPPISIWNATFKALASGASTEPERAMDLFLDLKSAGLIPTRETYNHLIRVMARARRPPVGTSARRAEAEKWYFGALRMLDRMIHEEGYRPDAQTYIALLEGCKRVGDLRRAKWIYGLLRRELDGSSAAAADQWTHVQAATLLMQTYASFVPASKLVHHSAPQKRPQIVIGEGQSSAKSPYLMAQCHGVPETKRAVIEEAEQIMNQFLTDTGELGMRAETRAEKRKLSILVGSYISVYASHGDIAGLHSVYERLTVSPLDPGAADGIKVLRITWIYLLVVERCEYVRSPERAGRTGRAAFKEWLGTREWQNQFELVESVEARLVSQLWAASIRLQAKFGGVDEAMADLEQFVQMYPIEDTSLESPYLVFKHLEILHHRLKQNENRQAEKRLLKIVKGYEKARMRAFVIEEEVRRIETQAVINV